MLSTEKEEWFRKPAPSVVGRGHGWRRAAVAATIPAVTDWRQIQARIRKAKAGPDASTKLTQLFDKTRDAMVAYELAAVMERDQRLDEAVIWYTRAAERFRRAEWKKKALDGLVRLGAPAPAESLDLAAQAEAEPPPPLAGPLGEAATTNILPEEERAAAAPQEGVAGRRTRRRRGRRGGRGRRRASAGPQAAEVASPAPPSVEAPLRPLDVPEPRAPLGEPSAVARVSWQPTLRGGEPALASRMAQLESQLRRMIASPTHALEGEEEAPAGPGVYMLSDADQVTHYYIEACDTLRVALKNLVKSGRGGRGETYVSLRPGLAEHLGISEAKVKEYLRKHCIVRWLQLDEGASQLAHFAIAVLRPVLNR